MQIVRKYFVVGRIIYYFCNSVAKYAMFIDGILGCCFTEKRPIYSSTQAIGTINALAVLAWVVLMCTGAWSYLQY